MHQVTDNNEFRTFPEHGGWSSTVTFYDTPTLPDRVLTDPNVSRGKQGIEVTIKGDNSPSTSLAHLWSYCEEQGYWKWNTDTTLDQIGSSLPTSPE